MISDAWDLITTSQPLILDAGTGLNADGTLDSTDFCLSADLLMRLVRRSIETQAGWEPPPEISSRFPALRSRLLPQLISEFMACLRVSDQVVGTRQLEIKNDKDVRCTCCVLVSLAACVSK
jgi:hypothetical protein